MSNKIKCLLINLLLLAGVYCSWGCSCCADCCNKCCDNGDNKNEKNNNETSEENKEQKDLYFKIEGGAINDNGLGCFGKSWFRQYNEKKKDNNNENTILLYKLTEQQKATNEEAGTLVYSKENKKLEYKNGGSSPEDLKDSKNKWAIFKVTTLNKVNNQEQKGNSYIFYCSDVSSLGGNGLFELVQCYSIEILAAKTTEVKTFRAMFWRTCSLLEQDTGQPDASGFIGLEKLDVSGAEELSYMFNRALFKQATINSLRRWRLRDNANIFQMFYVKGNSLSFKKLKWMDKKKIMFI